VTIITLTTDFGVRAGFPAIMKGVIYVIAPNVKAEVDGITEAYGHNQPGNLVAVVDSEEYIEITLVNGSAAQKLGARVSDFIEVNL